MNSPDDVIIQPWLDKAPKFSLDVQPASLQFSPEGAGESSFSKTVTITNKGYADLPIVKIVSHRDYIFSPVGDSSVIRASETLLVDVIYRPTTDTVDPNATLQIRFGCGIPLNVLVPLSVIA